MVKVSMNLSSKSINNVEELSRLFDEPNRTRVIALALEIALNIMSYKKEGTAIIVREKSGKESQLNFIVS